jgi:hypothetical protein
VGGHALEAGLLRVALHAQSRYSDHGWVAGSEITTAGMVAALRRHPAVGQAEVFAPFAYRGLLAPSASDPQDQSGGGGGDQGAWDLLLIEGWTGPVPRVIAALRAANPRVVVLHWCLDTYPSLPVLLKAVDVPRTRHVRQEDQWQRLNTTYCVHYMLQVITALDVDGYLTNSRRLVGVLGDHAPVLFLPLAADVAVMAPVPRVAAYAHPVVYLGQASTTKHRLLEVRAPPSL